MAFPFLDLKRRRLRSDSVQHAFLAFQKRFLVYQGLVDELQSVCMASFVFRNLIMQIVNLTSDLPQIDCGKLPVVLDGDEISD
jgi:hypothetical protein